MAPNHTSFQEVQQAYHQQLAEMRRAIQIAGTEREQKLKVRNSARAAADRSKTSKDSRWNPSDTIWISSDTDAHPMEDSGSV